MFKCISKPLVNTFEYQSFPFEYILIHSIILFLLESSIIQSSAIVINKNW